MKPDSSHIRQIKVVSNTHWDRESRRSFEKTRRRLLTMLDITIDILLKDPKYHSFTLDGQSILLDDYLEMRPEKRPVIERLMREGRLIAGPWYTLAEQFSIGAEPLVRNLMLGRKTVQKYGGTPPTVAYTPASWGQTGQLPQILADFGCTRTMFYRGISQDEADAEWIWAAPDGTAILASRFAIYARSNWYLQVHRPTTTGRVFEKDYTWGEFDEVPFRFADGVSGQDLTFDLKAPVVDYDQSRLKESIETMVQREGAHFTTPVFLAMNGNDYSMAHPLEAEILADARNMLGEKYAIEQTNLEKYWLEVEKHLDRGKLPTLTGERRSYMMKGMWTFLFPGTMSARTNLKQKDFDATTALVYYAEPLAALAAGCGAEYPARYLERGWRYLLTNHSHCANGGCARDAVCQDMEYRYRKVCDIGEIVVEDAMSHIAENLSPDSRPADVMQLVVFNPLPFARDAVVGVDLETPASQGGRAVTLHHPSDPTVERQPIHAGQSAATVESIWEVPRKLQSTRIKFYAHLGKLPAMGYRVYGIRPDPNEPRDPQTLITGPASMENEYLAVTVNANGSVDLLCKQTGRLYQDLNYLTDQGEVGAALQHLPPTHDRRYNTLGASAQVAVVEDGPLVGTIIAQFDFAVPSDCADGESRNAHMVHLPVRVDYRLEKGARQLRVMLSIDNQAKDHWLRANFPTGLDTDHTIADSHFDVVSRPIALPDSTGWAEKAGGTHPLRTFVAMTDGANGLAVLPRGLFEYEAFEDAQHTLSLTLLRACSIKLNMGDDKHAQLPDTGMQCPGMQQFEYAISVFAGDWTEAGLLQQAADCFVPVRAAMTGRGQGSLPMEMSLMTADNPNIHITAIKQAEDSRGLIVRLFNPLATEQGVCLRFGQRLISASLCKADESELESLRPGGNELSLVIAPKKIRTYRLHLAV